MGYCATEVMTMNMKLRQEAEQAKIAYKCNLITRNEAMKKIEPFITAYNEKSKEIAKKYGQRPKTINATSFLR